MKYFKHLDIEIIYYDSKVKDGKVTATASGRTDGLTLSKSGDSPEIENHVENSPIYTIKEFEISGIGNGDNTAATVKQNDSKKENKEGIKKEENNSTIPIIYTNNLNFLPFKLTGPLCPPTLHTPIPSAMFICKLYIPSWVAFSSCITIHSKPYNVSLL